MYLWPAVESCRFCVPYKRADLKPGTPPPPSKKPPNHPQNLIYMPIDIYIYIFSPSASLPRQEYMCMFTSAGTQ